MPEDKPALPADSTAALALDILMERVRWEGSEFERDVEGDPFLPDATSKDAQERFTHFCVDLERFVGCDRQSLGLPPSTERPCQLYHATWMSIPGRGVLLDSFGRLAENHEVPSDHRSFLYQFVDAVRKVIETPSKSSPLPRFFGPKGTDMSAGHFFIRPPFLLILYASGRPASDSNKFYNLINGVFSGDAIADGKLMKRFAKAIETGGRHAFYALHYATLPSKDRRNLLSAGIRPKLDEIIGAIEKGEHKLQSGLGADFVEAVTVHFQRQWGDRQEYQRKLATSQRAIEGNISHDLCRNLYYAIGLLDQGKKLVQTAPQEKIANVGRYLEAADESIHACFAVPYLSRRSRKGDTRPIWQKRSHLVTDSEVEALVTMFDRKLIAICDAERPLRRHVEVWREYSVDGVVRSRDRILDLGEAPGDWNMEMQPRPFSGWPFADRRQESTIDNQGRQAILFGPQTELIRNAIEAAARMTNYEEDDEPAAYGIHVSIDVASDGSRITGSVRNMVPFGQDPSDIPDNFLDKFAAMSEWLKARFVDRTGSFHVEWTLDLQGSDHGGEAAEESPID